ncbi:hypothetical protein IWQ60_002814 [Tieghemiomyces parasiticus]|uniref:Uncharacterized protein n=1 Tax=Tieghemiomyces parasiticus TaxID=78921 RepID=A0A9W8AGQ5_9FUNG|nr:hypothetical protein IWQ60_002814 [Tieghemiomyces parasiticus]
MDLSTLTGLAGKAIVIIGSPRGLSSSFAVKAAQLGAKVAFLQRECVQDTELDVVYQVACDLKDRGITVRPFVANVRDRAEVARVMQNISEDLGGIDVVISVLGSYQMVETFDTPQRDFSVMSSIDTHGVRNCVRAAVPYLRQSATPHVLICAPPLTFHDDWNVADTPYAMTRFALSMCARGLMGELAATNIVVNAIWPRIMIHLDEFNQATGYVHWRHLNRRPDVVVDAALWLLCQEHGSLTQNFWHDEDLLKRAGVDDLDSYAITFAPTKSVVKAPTKANVTPTAAAATAPAKKIRSVSNFFTRPRFKVAGTLK